MWPIQRAKLMSFAKYSKYLLTEWEKGVNMTLIEVEVENMNKALKEVLPEIGMSFSSYFFVELVDMEDQKILRFSPHLVVICELANNPVWSSARSK